MEVVLVMFRSNGSRRSFALRKDLTVVGRREDCDLRIPLGDISRKHCRLIKDGNELRIEDLGSSNGTFHNGARVQEATLSAGDSVQIGPVAFVVQVDGSPADDELQPVASTEAEPVAEAPADDSAAAAQVAGVADTSAEALPSGEFDPMAILDKTDSQVGDAGIVDIEQSRHGQ
jgi:pSer/pThr/pTyr-binding forkhead associated (FHA) protein